MQPSGRVSEQDACPGALVLHHADDGYLARVRIPGGALRTVQLRALMDTAIGIGDSRLELTSRGNIQLRGLPPGAGSELGRLLHQVGLLPSHSHERVRNIAASALTGRDRSGRLDVRPLVADLDRGLCADPALAQLPGRFLFTVDDGRDDVSGLRGDVGLLVTDGDTVALYLAGEDSGLRTRPDQAAAVALAAARAFLAARTAEVAPVWRLAELGPSGRDACARGVVATVDPGQVWRVEPAPAPDRASYRPAVGRLPQRGGLTALSVAIPLGRLDAGQAEILCQAAGDGSGDVLVTPWRTMLVPDLPPAVVAGWAEAVDAAGLTLDGSSPLVDVSACAGRPGCARSLADVRADAARVHTAVTVHTAAAGVHTASLPVHWSGCERGCGRPAGRHVQVRAVAGGYQVGLDDDVRALVVSATMGADRTAGVEQAGLDTEEVARLAAAVEAVRCGS